MAAPLSSGSEQLKKLHPYIMYGPGGAYDSRQVDKTLPDGTTVQGLYVRIDMPGVSAERLKVVKRSSSRTVTFTGKAPMRWPDYDTSDRVYAGYVVLDRDPADVDFTAQFIHGCLRFFFPRCDGSLHFLSPPPHHPDVVDDVADVNCYDNGDEDDDTVDRADCGVCYITIVEHDDSDSPTGIRLRGGRPVHINPHLLSGIQGIYEHKVVMSVTDGEELVYLRLDVPGVDYERYMVSERGVTVRFSAEGVQDVFPYEGRRGYVGGMRPSCSCCMYEVVDHDIKDGVMRILIGKTRTPDLPRNLCTLRPPKPGERVRNVSLNLDLNSLSSAMKYLGTN